MKCFLKQCLFPICSHATRILEEPSVSVSLAGYELVVGTVKVQSLLSIEKDGDKIFGNGSFFFRGNAFAFAFVICSNKALPFQCVQFTVYICLVFPAFSASIMPIYLF